MSFSTTFPPTPTRYRTQTYDTASSSELLMAPQRFISPTPSTGREQSIEMAQPTDKMALPSLLSPPESPETHYVPHIPQYTPSAISPMPHLHGRVPHPDEPLVADDVPAISLQTPLFSINEGNEPMAHQTIQREVLPPSSPSRPSPEEYQIFVSCAWRLVKTNPIGVLQRERRLMKFYKAKANRISKPSTTSTGSPLKRSLPASHRREKGQPTPRPIARTARTHKPTPKAASARQDVDNGLPSPTSFSGSPVPPASRQPREDRDFDSLPDYSPPLSTLPNPKCLATEWRGASLEIRNLPAYDKLHAAEAKLASALRLTPEIYLTSKRRMFIGKIKRTQLGKEFRKTDAQKACKIDVNKASKLWTAFEKVGWLELKHIQRYLGEDLSAY